MKQLASFNTSTSTFSKEDSFAWHIDKDAYVYTAFFILLWIIGVLGNVKNLTRNCCKSKKESKPSTVVDNIFILGKFMSLFNILLFLVRTFTTLSSKFLSPLAFGKLVCLIHYILNFHVVFGLHFISFYIAKVSYNSVNKKDAHLTKPKRLPILVEVLVMWAFLALIVFGGFMMGVKKPCIIPSQLSFAFTCYSVSVSFGGLIFSLLTHIKVNKVKLLNGKPLITRIASQSANISLLYFFCWAPFLLVILYNSFCEAFDYPEKSFMKILSSPPRILLNIIILGTLVSSAVYPFVSKLESLRKELNREEGDQVNLQSMEAK